jgi:hypothetical protein
MLECRGCSSRDLAPLHGSDAFEFCRRCLLVPRRATPAPGHAPATVFGDLGRFIERQSLGPESLVIGVGALPLLDRLADLAVPVLAIEPEAEEAAAARRTGLPVIEAPFGPELAEGLAASGRRADLVLVPGFGRLADPAAGAEAIARLLEGHGAAELGFASAAEILPRRAFAAVAAEATLPSLAAAEALLAPHGLHLNDASRAGRHHLMRARVSTERRQTARLAGLLEEEKRIGAHGARFYGGAASEVVAGRATTAQAGLVHGAA